MRAHHSSANVLLTIATLAFGILIMVSTTSARLDTSHLLKRHDPANRLDKRAVDKTKATTLRSLLSAAANAVATTALKTAVFMAEHPVEGGWTSSTIDFANLKTYSTQTASNWGRVIDAAKALQADCPNTYAQLSPHSYQANEPPTLFAPSVTVLDQKVLDTLAYDFTWVGFAYGNATEALKIEAPP